MIFMALIVTVGCVFALLCIRCVQPSGDKLLICTIAQLHKPRLRSISKSYIGARMGRIGA